MAAVSQPATQETLHVFFGMLHSHTSFSDGVGTPAEAFQQARSVGLDFFTVTEHNHHRAAGGDGVTIARDASLYVGPQPEALIPAATRLTENGAFVALYGQEFSTISRGNHVNVVGASAVIDVDNGAFDDLSTWLDQHPDPTGEPPVLQFNHPWNSNSPAALEYGADDFGARGEWVARMDRYAQLIEVINGPSHARPHEQRTPTVLDRDYLHYLNLGFHLAPTADQDNHFRTWGTSSAARTGVIATRLTQPDLLRAVRARHVYATEDPDLRLIFQVNGHVMGDIVSDFPVVGTPLRITFSIHDADEPDAEYRVEILVDEGHGGNRAAVVDEFSVEGNTAPGTMMTFDDVSFEGEGQYLFFRIHQLHVDGGEDRAWTAPVWFESAAPHPIAGPNVRIASLIPNPTGNDRQHEEITIRNDGSDTVNLAGWVLRDAAGRTWSLDGQIAPGAERTFRRQGQPMALNNGGDTVSLVEPSGDIVHAITYAAVVEGERVTP
jgi:hypothetical protein